MTPKESQVETTCEHVSDHWHTTVRWHHDVKLVSPADQHATPLPQNPGLGYGHPGNSLHSQVGLEINMGIVWEVEGGKGEGRPWGGRGAYELVDPPSSLSLDT